MTEHIIKICVAITIFLLSFAAVYSPVTDIKYNSYTRKMPKDITALQVLPGVKTVDIKDTSSIDTRAMSLDELKKNMIIDYYNVAQYNSDIAGWINIPNIGYYPLMKGQDNDFYLFNDEYKQYTINGSLFIDYRCENYKDVTLIYGHHMASGLMFGALEKYKQEDFFYNNEEITIFDGKAFYLYSPFSIYLFESRKYAIQLSFRNKTEKIKYMEDISRTSMYKKELDSYDISALFLQTCDYTFNEARLEVAFYLTDKHYINEDEIDSILRQ